MWELLLGGYGVPIKVEMLRAAHSLLWGDGLIWDKLRDEIWHLVTLVVTGGLTHIDSAPAPFRPV